MKKVKAKITRTVTEIAIITIDDRGDLVEYIEPVEELDMDNVEIQSIHNVISEY